MVVSWFLHFHLLLKYWRSGQITLLQDRLFVGTDSVSGRFLPFYSCHSSMQEIRLTLKKRSFPSRGRARLNAAHLPGIGASDGGQVDLVNEATGACVTVSIVADTMVLEGQVRVSTEDLGTLGLNEGDTVLVRKTAPLNEKIRKAAEDAGAA